MASKEQTQLKFRDFDPALFEEILNLVRQNKKILQRHNPKLAVRQIIYVYFQPDLTWQEAKYYASRIVQRLREEKLTSTQQIASS